ncbi:hypothetical protein [Flavobacterium aquiphilum]|uniref:hypothetical protein n=1 Tax=Flavobacterium aquiphilum TaxID=3003261 RepID=UPI00248098BC|nr:hypothetical protein [Flavobacterium aquiphilum]
MKQILLVFSILFLLTSCEIQYDAETKIVVTGQIIDENGIPIPHKNIDITIFAFDGIYSSDDLISFGKSDLNGYFTMVFPAPKGDYDFFIDINNIINQPNEFETKEIIAKRNNFEKYKLDLNKITLYKTDAITNLTLQLNKTSSNKLLKDIQIEGKLSNSHIDLNFKNEPFNLNTNYAVIKNQIVILKYIIIDTSNSSSTPYSVPITINNDKVIYIINY